MQGINTHKEFETVVLISRFEPPVSAIDAQLRSLAADGEEALTFASGGSGCCGCFPNGSACICGGTARSKPHC